MSALSHTPEARSAPLLEVDDLAIAFRSGNTLTEVVRSASFDLARGETLGLVGESGSGKTVTANALMGLAPAIGARITRGSIRLDGRDLTGLSEREWQQLRGDRISIVFQQPLRALNPAFTVGDQITESIRRHRHVSRKSSWGMAVDLLDRVHIDRPAERAHQYPHQLSGGMCQRVMIAMAIACEPDVLIADEPTTALDVTVQRRVLELLRELSDETGVAMIYITHDLGVVAEMCDRVAVMYSGEVVETGDCGDVLSRPTHPYTEGLLQALPKRGRQSRFTAIPGNVPSPRALPCGCRFHPRCQYAAHGRCDVEPVPLRIAGQRAVRCVRADEITLTGVLG